MKIALVAPGHIPAQTANSIQVMKMAQALAHLGHDLRIFAPGATPDVIWAELASQYGLDIQLDIYWLPARASMRRYDYATRALRAAQAWRADLMYSRLPQAATLAARRGLPTIFELHDMPSGLMGPWLLRRFLKAKGPRRLVVNTQYLANQVRQRYSLPDDEEFLTLAPNGVDLQRFSNLPEPSAARQQLGLAEGFTVGYTGHLYAGRGIGFVLELARKLPQVQFLFVGGKPEDVKTRQQQALGLANVHFTGFVPNAELPLYQAACDVLLLPYRQQVAGSGGEDIAAYTNPLKVFEYLAAARPILASDLPILHEILNGDNAVLLPSGYLEAWVAALEDLRRDAKRRAALAQAARATAEAHTWEKRAQRLLHGLAA